MNEDVVIIQPGNGPRRRFPWWIPLTIGVLIVLVGVGLLIWPFFAASWLLAVLFGSLLIANGIALLVGTGGAGVVGGLVLVLLGVLAVAFPEVTVSAFLAFFGVVLIGLGVLGLLIAVRFGPFAMLPAILAILGGVAALVWPEFALTFAAVACGVIAVLLGGWVISLSIRLRGMRLGPPMMG